MMPHEGDTSLSELLLVHQVVGVLGHVVSILVLPSAAVHVGPVLQDSVLGTDHV